MVIMGFNVVPLLKRTMHEIVEDRIPSLAAETAYYFFFSLFPLLLFLTPLLGLIGDGQQMMDGMLARLATTLPPDALSLVRRILQEVVTSRGGIGVMSLGALLAAWSGSNIFGAVMGALNVAYDATESRPWWKRQLLRLGSLAAAALIVVAATAVFVDGDRIARSAGAAMRLGPAAITALGAIQTGIAIALVVGLCMMLYRLLPNVNQRWSHLVVASLVATVLWIAATLLFRLYVQHFGAYNKTYGTIGGVIALLTWMYYSMFVLLVGGELASELHHGSGAVDPERGAVYLGRIVSESGPGRPSISRAKRAD